MGKDGKCKLLKLPEEGELNWTELKEVHDRWRSEADGEGSTGISMFITASAKLEQIRTGSCEKHPSTHSCRSRTHAARWSAG